MIRFLADALRFYFEFHARYDGFYGAFVHDPLVVAAALDPALVDGPSPWPSTSTRPAARATARRSRTGGGVRGRTPNVDVAVEVDAAEFGRRLVERVGALAAASASVGQVAPATGADGSPTDGGLCRPADRGYGRGRRRGVSVRGPLQNGACVDGNDDTRSGAPSGGRRRVLVADDSESYRRIARSQLAARGLDVVTVASGAEALDRLAAEPFDLLLVDGMMPRLDGPATAREIRRREAAAGAPRIPIVAITASGQPEDRQRMLEAGHRRPGGQAAARGRARPGARSMAALARHAGARS